MRSESKEGVFMNWTVGIVCLLMIPGILFAQPLRDIRDQAMHDVRVEDKTPFNLIFKDYNRCANDLRMMLEADNMADSIIVDSLKSVPAGGEIFVQTVRENVNPKKVRSYDYQVKDAKGRILLKALEADSTAKDADQAGQVVLNVLKLPKLSKGTLTVAIRDLLGKQLYEYSIATEEE